MRAALQAHLIALALGVLGCDQQQPIALKPAPDPGFKQGETTPVEPDQGPQRNRDGNVPLPPATAPTTPGEQNSPGAPVVPLSPTLSPTPPPTSSPTATPTTSGQVAA